MESDLQILMKFIAKNPPSLAILGGVLLMLVGGLISDPIMVNNGMIVFFLGCLLQVGWLWMQYETKKR